MLGTLVLNQLMLTTDAIVAGQYSELHLAGIGLALGVFTPVFFVVFGTFFILPSLFSQMYGARKFTHIGRSAKQMVAPALLMGGVGIVLLSYLPEAIFTAIGADPDVSKVAIDYINVLKWCTVPNAFIIIVRSVLEGMGHVRIITFATLLGLIVNIVADLVLVNGWWGFREYGAVGCGFATLFAYLVILTCIGWYGVSHPRARVTGAVLSRGSTIVDPGFRRSVIQLGVPVAVSIGIELAMFAGAALVLAPLGQQQVAINQIALNVASIAYMLPLALALSGTVRIGNLIGAGRPEKARYSVLVLLSAACVAAALNMLIMTLLATEISSLYSNDSATIALAASLLFLAGVFQFPDCIQGACVGALRAVNVVKFPMWTFFFVYMSVGIPVGIALSHYPIFGGPHGAFGMWSAMVIALSLCALCLGYKVYVEFRTPGPSLEGPAEKQASSQ